MDLFTWSRAKAECCYGRLTVEEVGAAGIDHEEVGHAKALRFGSGLEDGVQVAVEADFRAGSFLRVGRGHGRRFFDCVEVGS